MIRINSIKLNENHKSKDLEDRIRKKLSYSENDEIKFSIYKKSIDARKKEKIQYIYAVNVFLDNEEKFIKRNKDRTIQVVKEKKYKFPPKVNSEIRPVIVGSGPAGLFVAYCLLESGIKPLIIERGECVDERIKTVERFWKEGILNPESNVQFGEGGAGTFSDGKLNTMVNDKVGRNTFVLETFVRFGAKKEILYQNKPHIGTDVLCNVVKNMRKYIIKNGGEIRFNTCLIDIITNNNKLEKIQVKNQNNEETIFCKCLILAVGNSARDTFSMIYERGIKIQPKPFAVGFRITHPQKLIDKCQYGKERGKYLPPAEYKLTYRSSNERSVYSFCMCPGGFVVDASSEKGRLAVNGMSYSGRDGLFANSAIVVSVHPEDFISNHPLKGMEFQRKIEEKAFQIGHGKIPAQKLGDYKNNIKSIISISLREQTKGQIREGNLRSILPDNLSTALIEGIEYFGKILPGFNDDEVLLFGVESRTSSPIRILRNEFFQASIEGIFPCGEGAGYAGGITSAAMDGIKVFEELMKIVYH